MYRILVLQTFTDSPGGLTPPGEQPGGPCLILPLELRLLNRIDYTRRLLQEERIFPKGDPPPPLPIEPPVGVTLAVPALRARLHPDAYAALRRLPSAAPAGPYAFTLTRQDLPDDGLPVAGEETLERPALHVAAEHFSLSGVWHPAPQANGAESGRLIVSVRLHVMVLSGSYGVDLFKAGDAGQPGSGWTERTIKTANPPLPK